MTRSLVERRLFLAGGLMWLAACSQAADPADAVNLSQARADVEAGQAVLIDVREPLEHAQGVAPGARLLPRSQLGQRLGEIPRDPKRPVYLICATQNRSRATLQELRGQGAYTHVRYVVGGMKGWIGQGWPVVRPLGP